MLFDKKEVAQRLLRYRVANYITQAKACKIFNVSNSTILKIEKMQDISEKTLAKVILKLEELGG